MKDSQDWLDDLFDDWLGKAKGFTPSDSSLSATLKTRHIVASDAKSAIRKHILQEALEMIGDMEERETDDMSLQSWGKEDYEAFGRNMLRNELRNKFNDKYKED